MSPCLKNKPTVVEMVMSHTGHTDRVPGSACDSPCWGKWLPLVVLRFVGQKKKKPKGLQSYVCHLVFVHIRFFLMFSKYVWIFVVFYKVVWCIVFYHQKTILFSVKHYTSYLNPTGGAGLALLNDWAHGVVHSPFPWKGSVWAKNWFWFCFILCFLTLQCKYVVI